ncbi:hypothetical protein ACHMW7_09440 [Aminobacter sp. UC22_36]|uniref:hypothetical protein n=1 Tax=Aminobacter sp. UC22_36 TaxID=3374549 RepID=UPI00375818D2
MENGGNIWSTSLRIMKKEIIYVLAYCAMIVVFLMIEEKMENTSASSIALTFASAMLAIPAHLSVLSRLSTADAMRELQSKSPRYIGSFVFRTIVLGAISGAPILALVIFLSANNWGRTSLIATAVLALLLLAALVFAKWGTMLPAIVMQSDRTFAAAGRRGRMSFFYSFPRLLVSFGLLSVVQILAIAAAANMLGAGDSYFPAAGGFDFGLLLSAMIGTAISSYQIVMTAVILSRSYLRAENAANGRDLVAVEAI